MSKPHFLYLDPLSTNFEVYNNHGIKIKTYNQPFIINVDHIVNFMSLADSKGIGINISNGSWIRIVTNAEVNDLYRHLEYHENLKL